MTEYIYFPESDRSVIHKRRENGEPWCGLRHTHNPKPASKGMVDECDMCKNCAGTFEPKQSFIENKEQIFGVLSDQWLSPSDLARRDDIGLTRSQIRRHCEELYEADRVNKRKTVRPTQGGKGFEFSQQEPEQTEYEENNNLFESMLAND